MCPIEGKLNRLKFSYNKFLESSSSYSRVAPRQRTDNKVGAWQDRERVYEEKARNDTNC